MFFHRTQKHTRPASANVQATANNTHTNSAPHSGVNRVSHFSPMRQHSPTQALGTSGQSATVQPQRHAGTRLSPSPRGSQPTPPASIVLSEAYLNNLKNILARLQRNKKRTGVDYTEG